MASSDTLSIFVPNPGETITQTTTSGARVLTSLNGDTVNSRIFPNQGRNISDVGIQEPSSGDTRTTFSGASRDTSYIGNGDDNTVTFTGNASNTTVSTGGGDDTLIFGGKVTGSTFLLGLGADVIDFSARVQNTWIDLGNDTAVDQVFFNTRSDLGVGTQIFGAGDGDLLIIGGEEYTFDDSQTAFISNQGDSITFG